MRVFIQYVIITLVLLMTFIAGFSTGTRVYTPLKEKTVSVAFPTGKEVLQELNSYRRQNNLPEFILSPILCDNIAERWQNYQNTDSHAGWAEFMQKEYPPGFTASEILVSGKSAQEMIQKWSESPSHDLAIKTYTKICVYSGLGSSVAILSN